MGSALNGSFPFIPQLLIRLKWFGKGALEELDCIIFEHVKEKRRGSKRKGGINRIPFFPTPGTIKEWDNIPFLFPHILPFQRISFLTEATAI